MQINLGRGTLASLERELLPVAVGNPQKPVYRRLLVEVYGAMTFPLVHAARFGSDAQRTAAREELATIGARAVKPLLDALSDKNPAQQRIAIEVLAYVQNRGAGPALFNFATGQADRDLRVRAMIACGALDDPALLDRFEKLLVPRHSDAFSVTPGDSVSIAGAWGVARMGSTRAEPLLLEMLEAPSPEVRALAAIGLGLGGNARHAERLASLARSPLAGPIARAAAAFALGELGAIDQRPLLLALVDATEFEVKQAALLALGKLEAGSAEPNEDVAAAVARAILSEHPGLRKTALAVATVLDTHAYRSERDRLAVPDGVISLSNVLRQLAPTGYTRAEQARALVSLRPALAKAAIGAVATSPQRAAIVAELTMTQLTPLLDANTTTTDATVQAELRRTADAMASASTPGFVALARHPSKDVRKRAIEFLAHRNRGSAKDAVIGALTDGDGDVVKTALSTLGRANTRHLDTPETLRAVVALSKNAPSWSVRARAAEALGRVGTSGSSKRDAVSALTSAALSDEFALVREAAIHGLGKLATPEARATLAAIASNDPEPRLRTLARNATTNHDATNADTD